MICKENYPFPYDEYDVMKDGLRFLGSSVRDIIEELIKRDKKATLECCPDDDPLNCSGGSWVLRVAHALKPENYLNIDITVYSRCNSLYELVFLFDIVEEDEIIASLQFRGDHKELHFMETDKYVLEKADKILSFAAQELCEERYRMDDCKEAFEYFSDCSAQDNCLADHIDMLRKKGYGDEPGRKAVKHYDEKIDIEFKRIIKKTRCK